MIAKSQSALAPSPLSIPLPCKMALLSRYNGYTVADWLSRMYPLSIGLSSLNSLAATALTNLLEMFHSVHGHRSLHHGAKKTYLAMCTRYPGDGVPMRIIQDLVAESPLCQKDRVPHTTIPHPTSIQTLLHHTRSIGIDHVNITPHDEDGYVGLLLAVEQSCCISRP